MSIKQKIQGIIKTGLDKLEIDFELDKIIIETPKDTKHGDYSTNIALVLTKELRKNPNSFAAISTFSILSSFISFAIFVAIFIGLSLSNLVNINAILVE